MVRHLVRPEEGHALREMRHEGLEGVMEHCRNAIRQAEDEGDLRLARLYARQQDRAAAEMLARRLERQASDRQHEDTMTENLPDPIREGYSVEREVAQYRLMLQDGHITEAEYRRHVRRLEGEHGG